MQKISNINDRFLKQELSKLQNQPLIHGIIEKKNPGEIFLSKDQKAILIKSNDTYTALAGELDSYNIDEMTGIINSYPQIKLLCEPKHHHIFLKKGFNLCPRIELINDNSEIIDIKNSNYIYIDNIDIFRKCIWFNFISNLYGTAENFFTNSFGVALTIEGTIVSEAYMAFIGGGMGEIAIVTNPKFYGKGYATDIIKIMIQEARMKKLIPIWSCDASNPASLKVALKNNFRITSYYAFLKNY